MKSEKVSGKDLNNVSGGRIRNIFDRFRYEVLKNVCKRCGKTWEYKAERFRPNPNCATHPWCPECRSKHMEEVLKREHNENIPGPKEVSNENLNNVSGGNEEEFFNVCKECGKVWDMRPYGYGKDTSMPNWVTGPWCPDCRKKHNEEFFTKSSEQHNDSV